MRRWLALHWPLAHIARWVRSVEAEMLLDRWGKTDAAPSGFDDPSHPAGTELPPIVTGLVPLGEDARTHL